MTTKKSETPFRDFAEKLREMRQERVSKKDIEEINKVLEINREDDEVVNGPNSDINQQPESDKKIAKSKEGLEGTL